MGTTIRTPAGRDVTVTGAFPAWLEGRMVTNGVPVVAWGPVTLRTAGTANERRGRPSAEPRPLCRLFQHLDVNSFYDLLVLHVWPFQTPSVTVSTSGMALSLPCPPALSDKPALTATEIKEGKGCYLLGPFETENNLVNDILINP